MLLKGAEAPSFWFTMAAARTLTPGAEVSTVITSALTEPEGSA